MPLSSDHCHFRPYTLLALAITILIAHGCRNDSSDRVSEERVAPQPPKPIKILFVDDETLPDVVARHWMARSEGKITIDSISSAELLQDSLAKSEADVVVYPAGLLGELVENNWLLPLPEKMLASDFDDRNDILLKDRTAIVTWGKTVFGVSLGSPQLVLIYRKDIFDALDLQVPTSWQEYESIREKLNDRQKIVDSGFTIADRWSGAVEPWRDNWISHVFLARSVPYVRDPLRYSTVFSFLTLEPLLDRNPFVLSASEMSAVGANASHDLLKLGPEQAKELVFDGEAAMAIGYPTPDSGATELDPENEIEVSIAPLPGSSRVFDFNESKWSRRPEGAELRAPLLGTSGLIASVSRSSKYSGSAFRFIAWLSNRENSPVIVGASGQTAPFRSSHLRIPEQWIDSRFEPEAALAWDEIIRTGQVSTMTTLSLRIPNRDRYLQSLGDSLRQMLREGVEPEEALKTAVESWNAISAENGLRKQREAYQRSLGISD